VFPTVLSLRVIDAHAARVARATQPIRFVLRRAGVVSDAVGEGGHVFLMPEEGRDELTRLHDRLYDGPLQSHQRLDVSFTPHLTVAAHPTLEPLNALVTEINAGSRGIRGFIADIAVVEVTPAVVQPVGRFQLGPS
jgi:2'-5' RNA ligase